MNDSIILSDFTGDGHFGPLTTLTPASELRCGALSLRTKLATRLEAKGISNVCHDPAGPFTVETKTPRRESRNQPSVLLSSRTLLKEEALEVICSTSGDTIFTGSDQKIVGLRLAAGIDVSRLDLASIVNESGVSRVTVPARRVDFPWELDKWNSDEIVEDLALFESIDRGTTPPIPSDVISRGSENIRATGDVHLGAGAIFSAERFHVRLEKGTIISAGAIISAAKGPVWIGENSVIEPGAIIEGPAYIGDGSIVRAGARVRGSVSLGRECRVGGELSNVIMQSFSNKQHSGYLGGAVLGSWVNLGAATDNSDLKNNYRPIDVTLDGRKFDTGDLHIGVFLGDFVRTAIQTRLNSGSAVGTCCNLFGNDFPEKSIPPFIWHGSDGYQEYRLDKAIDTIKIVLSRRKMEMTPSLEESLNKLFDVTRPARLDFLNKQSRAIN